VVPNSSQRLFSPPEPREGSSETWQLRILASCSCEYLRSGWASKRPFRCLPLFSTVHRWMARWTVRFYIGSEMHGHSFDITKFARSWFHRRNFFLSRHIISVCVCVCVCVFLLARAANAIIPKYYTVLLGCDYGGQIVCWPRRMQAHLTTQITAFRHNLRMLHVSRTGCDRVSTKVVPTTLICSVVAKMSVQPRVNEWSR
jgi:hypothetical protein